MRGTQDVLSSVGVTARRFQLPASIASKRYVLLLAARRKCLIVAHYLRFTVSQFPYLTRTLSAMRSLCSRIVHFQGERRRHRFPSTTEFCRLMIREDEEDPTARSTV